jgi:uncharacterized protein
MRPAFHLRTGFMKRRFNRPKNNPFLSGPVCNCAFGLHGVPPRVTEFHRVVGFFPALFLFALLVSGCAMSTGFYKSVDADVASNQFEKAAAVVRANRDKYGSNSSVLYNLEEGLLLHYAGDYNLSTEHLAAGEQEMDELYTKSISKIAGSFVMNDNELPYQGEDFEKVYVNLFMALNYAELGKLEDAIVEARKVDLKLNEYSEQYSGKNSFKQDAFIRYIMGLLYEADGDANDAFISYRQAYIGYKQYDTLYNTECPSFLEEDLVRTAGEMGFTDDLQRYESEFGIGYSDSLNSMGNLLLVVYSGKGPVKEQVKLRVSIPDTGGVIHSFIVAVPKFHARQKGVRSYEVSVTGAAEHLQAATQVGENVNRIAEKDLQDRIGLIYLKAGGRALLKFLAAEKIKKEAKAKGKGSRLENLISSSIVDAAYSASEQADLRIWRTLPHDIQIAQFPLPPGDYSLTVDGPDGAPLMSGRVLITAGSVVIKILPDLK